MTVTKPLLFDLTLASSRRRRLYNSFTTEQYKRIFSVTQKVHFLRPRLHDIVTEAEWSQHLKKRQLSSETKTEE